MVRKKSKNFKVLYKKNAENLSNYVIKSAENSLKTISHILKYTPSEKIVIIMHDFYDYGSGSTATVPQNIIRIGIEPPEPGYESITYNEHLQWVLSHELVHIAVNDQASNVEDFFRTIFGKVAPEQELPISFFYSLLTNYSRYTPLWHQESVAVFFETWLSGGFGRLLTNFDEMYFRSVVLDGEKFVNPEELETDLSHNSFLLGTTFYLYGARFCIYLSNKYGSDKFIEWYTTKPDEFYPGYINKFENIYKSDFNDEWNNFIFEEIQFQKTNILKLETGDITPLNKITKSAYGWVSQPHVTGNNKAILFCYHKAHQLAGIAKLDLKSGNLEIIATLPTPSMLQVASTAYDKKRNIFFYTTNNNQFYRDLWSFDLNTNEHKLLFENFRIGHLTVCSETGELWGIQHANAKASLVYSPYPYEQIRKIHEFKFGQEIQQLAVSPEGKSLAATIHLTNGTQSIGIINIDLIKSSGTLKFKTLVTEGSPENPSWSIDGNTLFWNGVNNGVSNIYKISNSDSVSAPISNTHTGLFKAIELNDSIMFAFNFRHDGFIPSTFTKSKIEKLPATNYYGEYLIRKNPKLLDLALKPSVKEQADLEIISKEKYNSLANLKIQTFIPTITGFLDQYILGFYTHIADPTNTHNLSVDLGYSIKNKQYEKSRFHLKAKYEYSKKLELMVDYNPGDFYDLFNKRKKGFIGSRYSAAHTFYWKYDNPHKIFQKTNIDYYTNMEFWNDNITKIAEPDFLFAQTNINSIYLRKSIGSCDYENGNEYDLKVSAFSYDPDEPKYSLRAYGKWDNYSTWITDHNVFRFQLSGGYIYNPDELIQARFYFGGFGNRYVENQHVKHYRKVFRMPGFDLYSIPANGFAKLQIENNFPPIRATNIGLGQHLLNHIDFSVYANALYCVQDFMPGNVQNNELFSVGGQINFIFKHWFNLESTFSAGIAAAYDNKFHDYQWFLSYKLLRN
ncbi:MAG: hypothetical protein JEY94_17700 [Melioribacteraceae bacterium]|nr:hypothetical protein [Melioribacteraceae bacterium]